ncbi:UNVERIFIED_CONTAM: Retrovirus-related Pol polyprotein from transposon RE1, partial [Sesamum latifolium]
MLSIKSVQTYDLNTHRIFISRDVTFFEHNFPFVASQDSPPSHHPLPPVPLIVDCLHDSSLTPPTTTPSPPHMQNLHHLMFLIFLILLALLTISRFLPGDLIGLPISPTGLTTLFAISLLHPSCILVTLHTCPLWLLYQFCRSQDHLQRLSNFLNRKRPWTLKSRASQGVVARGYNQVEGVDYVDNFSLVAKAVTVRIFLDIVSAYSWPIQQLDINNAFLHGYLDDGIYMAPLEGYAALPGLV